MDSKALLEARAAAVNKYLSEAIPDEGLIFDAMRYSLLAGGKRLRPVLLLEFAALAGVTQEDAMPFAAALEMIHTYSLIHDDLPCMDDDDVRRGLPTSHKVYGEAAAVLAGDGLLTLAFETMLAAGNIRSADMIAAAKLIASAAGCRGMVGGQTEDTVNVGERELTLPALRGIDEKKTGALFGAACVSGLLLGGCRDSRLAAAETYAGALGLAFQIRDDVLDITPESSGAGSDEKSGKRTYVGLMGLDGCKEEINRLTDRAVRAAETFEKSDFLIYIARSLSERKF